MNYATVENSMVLPHAEPPEVREDELLENQIERETEDYVRGLFDSGDEDSCDAFAGGVMDDSIGVVRLLLSLDEGKEDAALDLHKLVNRYREQFMSAAMYGPVAEAKRAAIRREWA